MHFIARAVYFIHEKYKRYTFFTITKRVFCIARAVHCISQDPPPPCIWAASQAESGPGEVVLSKEAHGLLHKHFKMRDQACAQVVKHTAPSCGGILHN